MLLVLTISEGAKLRPPYKTTNSISMYHIRQTIEEYPELLEAFGIDKNQHQWCPWFGLKYDLDNKERPLKLFIMDMSKLMKY